MIKKKLINFNYNYDLHKFVKNVCSHNFKRTLSNGVTCHDRHETDNCCFLWYVKFCEKDFYLVVSTKLDTFANNSHLPRTIIDNFYASRVDSDPNFLCHNKWNLKRKEFCG